jgi:Nucleotidyl transferase AbiEii toxin, Type IV TA system
MSQLEDSLRSMVSCFNSLGIPYVVMGGLAVRIHALPRPTNDVDFTILLARERLVSWFAAAEQIGFTVPETYKNGWVDQVAGMPIVKLRTYLEEGLGVDIDVFLAESDFQKSLIERRLLVEVDSHSMYVVTPEDLLLLKLIANRPRDLVDIQDLLFTQGRLDETYLRYWAEALEVTDRLEKVLAESS